MRGSTLSVILEDEDRLHPKSTEFIIIDLTYYNISGTEVWAECYPTPDLP